MPRKGALMLPVACIPTVLSFTLFETTSESSCSRARVEQEEQEEIDVASVSLLQSSGRVVHQTLLPPPPAPEDYLQAAMPLAWTHVPKCGTSFVNSLVRLPGVCPSLPVGDTIIGGSSGTLPTNFPDWQEHCSGVKTFDDIFFRVIGPEEHRNVGSLFEDVYHNHGVIMLRQPEQRSISMYNHGIKSLEKNGMTPMASLIVKYNMTVLDFTNATAGCAVRMLTKDGKGLEGCMGTDLHSEFPIELEVSFADVIEAKKRLRGYAFVGITDYWTESVCLLHAMFGGECHPAEFSNVRNKSLSADDYDTAELKGFVDQYDGALYEEAVSIFTENLRRYRLSQNSCKQCFQSGGLSSSDQEKTFQAVSF